MHIFLRLLLLLFATSMFAQTDTTFCKKSRLILKMLEENHYKPKAIDDDFSAYVFDKLFERLDDRRLLYSQEDVATLEGLKNQLDDYLLEGNCDFINEFIAFYEKHLKRTKETIEKLEKTIKNKDKVLDIT